MLQRSKRLDGLDRQTIEEKKKSMVRLPPCQLPMRYLADGIKTPIRVFRYEAKKFKRSPMPSTQSHLKYDDEDDEHTLERATRIAILESADIFSKGIKTVEQIQRVPFGAVAAVAILPLHRQTKKSVCVAFAAFRSLLWDDYYYFLLTTQ